MTEVGASFAVLFATFMVQKAFAWMSRTTDRVRWEREDWLLWPDWLAAGVVTMIVFGWQELDTETLTRTQYASIVTLPFLAVFITMIVREVGYDKNSPFTLLTWRGIVLPNVMGTCGMLLAVVAGLSFGNVG